MAIDNGYESITILMMIVERGTNKELYSETFRLDIPYPPEFLHFRHIRGYYPTTGSTDSLVHNLMQVVRALLCRNPIQDGVHLRQRVGATKLALELESVHSWYVDAVVLDVKQIPDTKALKNLGPCLLGNRKTTIFKTFFAPLESPK